MAGNRSRPPGSLQQIAVLEDPTFAPPPWTARTRRYKQLVEEALSDDQVFLFVDAYDVLVMGSPAELLRNYSAAYDFGSIVFSCCRYNWPEACPAWQAAPRCPWGAGCNDLRGDKGCHWANGGVFMGTAGSLRAFLRLNPLEDDGPLADDQCWVNHVFSKGDFPLLQLDVKHKLFYGTLWDMSNNCNIRVSAAQRFQVIDTHIEPIVVHLDGGHPTFETLKNFHDFRHAVVGSAMCYQFPRWNEEPDEDLPSSQMVRSSRAVELLQIATPPPAPSLWQRWCRGGSVWLGCRSAPNHMKGGFLKIEI